MCRPQATSHQVADRRDDRLSRARSTPRPLDHNVRLTDAVPGRCPLPPLSSRPGPHRARRPAPLAVRPMVRKRRTSQPPLSDGLLSDESFGPSGTPRADPEPLAVCSNPRFYAGFGSAGRSGRPHRRLSFGQPSLCLMVAEPLVKDRCVDRTTGNICLGLGVSVRVLIYSSFIYVLGGV